MLKVILVTFVLKGVGVKLPPRGISASRLARNKIPTGSSFRWSRVCLGVGRTVLTLDGDGVEANQLTESITSKYRTLPKFKTAQEQEAGAIQPVLTIMLKGWVKLPPRPFFLLPFRNC